MDSIVLKSLIPEIFLSVSILCQLLFNVRLINNPRYNFPIIGKEVFYQTIFIMSCLLYLYFNLKIEGYFANFLFVMDESSRLLKILTLLASFFILSTIFQSFENQRLNFFEFFTIFLLAVFSLLLLISCSDLIAFYLIIEMQSLCFYILASFKRDSSFSTEAGLKYFISGAFMSGIFLFGSSLIYGILGTLNFNAISLLLAMPFDEVFATKKFFLEIGAWCVTATLLFKLACAPFHFWAPDVYEGSPLSSTIIFSIIPKFALVFFFIKWLICLNFMSSLQSILLFCGVLSAFVGTFFALSQKRLKKLIIYSSIAQIGFIVAGLSLGTVSSYTAVLFFLVIYLITSILVWSHFSLFYSFQDKINNFWGKKNSSIFLSSLTNFFHVNKLWSFSFVIIFFSIGGIPPLTGFLSKIYILSELMSSGSSTDLSNISIFYYDKFFVVASLLWISAISAFYYIRIIKILFFEPKSLEKSYEKFQVVFHNAFLDRIYFINCFLMFTLLFTFFFPTPLLLGCQYIIIKIFTI